MSRILTVFNCMPGVIRMAFGIFYWKKKLCYGFNNQNISFLYIKMLFVNIF